MSNYKSDYGFSILVVFNEDATPFHTTADNLDDLLNKLKKLLSLKKVKYIEIMKTNAFGEELSRILSRIEIIDLLDKVERLGKFILERGVIEIDIKKWREFKRSFFKKE